MKLRLISVALACLFTTVAEAAVRLPSIISDNMVLQQRTTVNIWGWAEPGENIAIKPSWQQEPVSVVAQADGRWRTELHTPAKTAQAQTLTISSITRGGSRSGLMLENILIGEVWLCSGQSNMDFQVAKSKGWRTGILNHQEEMRDADYPSIRLFHVEQTLSPGVELDDCKGRWMVCNPENLKEFSAVAFFFGREIYNHIHTPVGLVQSTWGGTHAESWTKMSVIESDPVYASLLEQHKTDRDNYPADIARYEAEMEKYEVEKAAAIERGETPAKAPKKPQGINHNKALSTLWNGMVSPLVPYTIKGVIWYQGESNSIRHGDYTRVFTNMINCWRTEWAQGDFPFYFVQIAPHYKQPPQIREAQLRTWQSVERTGMVVITDAGDSTDIHPRNKRIPGERLARWALAKDYGVKTEFSGPLYKSMNVKKNKAILDFDYSKSGLVSQGGELQGFEVAGEDKVFYPATARIEGRKVVVTSGSVPAPAAVRYGWGKFFRANLTNGAGLPASPFRTDDRVQ